jgi:predicted alpha/beta-hydrolase family hydrolase
MFPVETPHGLAHVHLDLAARPAGALVLGHGASGGVGARDLVAVATVARSEDFCVALVEQPYRVAGRRSPAPARQLDGSWIAVVERLLEEELRGLPHVVGGRSSGARVACRTAGVTGAAGVFCLAFPLQPPTRSRASPAPSRLHELDAVTVPTLVVQGVRDPFGMPPAAPGRTVAEVQADHSLRTDLEAVAAAVRDWLPGVVGQALPPAGAPTTTRGHNGT